MNNKINTLNLLSHIKGYYKTLAAKELLDVKENIEKVQSNILDEELNLKQLYEDIRNSRNSNSVITSQSYQREHDSIRVIQLSLEKLQKQLSHLKEKERTKKQQILREMSQEKLYNKVVKETTRELKNNELKKADFQLQEQWQIANYKK